MKHSNVLVTPVKNSHEFFTSVIRTHDMCDKFIKKSVYYTFIFTAPYLPKHNTVVKRKRLRRYPVVLKETMNRADTKVSVTLEPEFILSHRYKTRHCGESNRQVSFESTQ